MLLADPAEADAAHDFAALRRDDCERRSRPLVPVRRRLLDPQACLGLAVRLRDHVQPARDLLVAVETVDERLDVAVFPRPQRHEAVGERGIGRDDQAADASCPERQGSHPLGGRRST